MGGVAKKIGGGIKGALFGKKGQENIGFGDPRLEQMYGNVSATNSINEGPEADMFRKKFMEQGGTEALGTLRGDTAGRQQAIQAMQAGLGGYTGPEESAMFQQAAERARQGAMSSAATARQQALQRGQTSDPLQQLRAQQMQQRGGQMAARDMAVMNAQEAARRRAELAQVTSGSAGQLGQMSQNLTQGAQQAELNRRNLAMQQMGIGGAAEEAAKRKGGGLERLGEKIGGYATFGM